MVFSDDGGRLATAATSEAVGTSFLPRPVRIWQADEGRLLATLLGHLKVVHSIAFSPDGNLIATGSEDDTVGIWDARAVRDLAMLEGYRRRLAEIATEDAAQFADDAPIAFSPDGGRLLLASDRGGASLWDVATAKRLRDFRASSSPVSAVAFNPRNSTQAVVGSFDGGLRVWNTNLQSDPVTLKGLTGAIASIRFSDDGILLLAASWDGLAQIWDTATWAPKATLRGHDGAILAAALSHDGKYVITGSTDNTAKLWSVDGALLATLVGHDNRVVAVSFVRMAGF